MKIFGWMQSKLYGRHDNKKSNSIISVDYHSRQESRKEEFSDWPHELLAIGTFGNNSIKEEAKHNRLQENPSFSQTLPRDLTPGEVGKLQNELDILLHKQGGSTEVAESETANFFDRQTGLEDDRTNSEHGCSDESNNKDFYLQANASTVVPSRRKDIFADTNTAINKNTLSFLLKKIFICGSGSCTPTPSLKNQVPESRIEKILRTILHKKIYPQNPSPTSRTKKYLENKQKPKSVGDDETNEKADDGSKWVKTDSECKLIWMDGASRYCVGDIIKFPLARGEEDMLVI